MASASLPVSSTAAPTVIWLVGVSFVLFQFFLQLSSGVVIGSIMDEMHLSALGAGMLGSAFYYVYTTLQIPVGILFDRRSTRFLLTVTALICTCGCLIFAQSHSMVLFFIGRLLIGGGAAFAFIGLSHLLREHFPLQRFAFMIGLSETLGFIITMLGLISLGALINHWGWRGFINGAAVTGIIIAFLCWNIIPESIQKPKSSIALSKQLKLIFASGRLWANGLYVGFSFTIITVFGAMWAVPFLQVKLNSTLTQASIIDAMIFCGAAISCPLYGYLAAFLKRRPLMIFSSLITAILLTCALFAPITSPITMGLLMFLVGLACGAYMLSYTVANELSPKDAVSTCTGFTNTLAMLTAPLMQPLVGYILDSLNSSNHNYNLHDYQLALLIIPAALVIASILVLFLPEKS